MAATAHNAISHSLHEGGQMTLDLTGYTLAFADEFSGSVLNTYVWGTCYWWGGRSLASNGEQQYFADENTDLVKAYPSYHPFATEDHPIQPGARMLVITARPSPDPALSDGLPYISGLIQSCGSFGQQHGFFEMVARVPKGQGLWPAFWLLPRSGEWPPEIDVMEILGGDTNTYFASTHWKDSAKKHTFRTLPVNAGRDLAGGFNAYGLRWTETELVFTLNRIELARVPLPASVNVEMYLLAGLAVGGSWGGNPDQTTSFPARLEIEAIRVWSPPVTGGKGKGNGKDNSPRATSLTS